MIKGKKMERESKVEKDKRGKDGKSQIKKDKKGKRWKEIDKERNTKGKKMERE